MSRAGPELPPHMLAKRKRQETADDAPQAPPQQSSSTSSSPDPSKKQRILGPSLPPRSPPLHFLPPGFNPAVDSPHTSASASDSDSDSIGPTLPPSPGHLDLIAQTRRDQALAAEAAALEAAKKPQREEWMLVPPKQNDWSSRVDPTKLRNRKFNSGKGSKAPAQKGGRADDMSLWTETPEQKRQRLEDEIMGVRRPAQLEGEEGKQGWKEREAKETDRRIREYNEKNRNTSLYSAHKKAGPKEKEDDPSARAFDWEKDMGSGAKIGHAQKRELLNRAADFGSRFEGGNYL
ncbi:hypothetical protein MMC12_005069 [Toensbergia leucococca]|nr:hypothetical protein [Toensbergia leucococca]